MQPSQYFITNPGLCSWLVLGEMGMRTIEFFSGLRKLIARVSLAPQSILSQPSSISTEWCLRVTLSAKVQLPICVTCNLGGAQHSRAMWDGRGRQPVHGLHINSECIEVSAEIHGCCWLGYWSILAGTRGYRGSGNNRNPRSRVTATAPQKHPKSRAELLSKHQPEV